MATNVHTPSTRHADLMAAQPEDVVAAVCAPPQQSELTGSEVVEVAELLGVDFAIAPFSVEDLQLGLEVELEIGHECAPSMVDALDEDLVELGMVAVANLRERSDYYTRLTRAQAPGDPPLPRHEHADVGSD
jgi:Protein of unknown function (DUF5661)